MLMASAVLSVDAQNIRFYKYGREVMSVNTDDVSSITTLTAEQHPLVAYGYSKLLSVTPDEDASNRWYATVEVSDAEESVIGFTSTPECDADTVAWGVSPYLREGRKLTFRLPSNHETYLQLMTKRRGVPFLVEPLHIVTGR